MRKLTLFAVVLASVAIAAPASGQISVPAQTDATPIVEAPPASYLMPILTVPAMMSGDDVTIPRDSVERLCEWWRLTHGGLGNIIAALAAMTPGSGMNPSSPELAVQRIGEAVDTTRLCSRISPSREEILIDDDARFPR